MHICLGKLSFMDYSKIPVIQRHYESHYVFYCNWIFWREVIRKCKYSAQSQVVVIVHAVFVKYMQQI
jgi:hypothetical protein